MARIEGLRIKNFRVLKDITLGKLWNTPKNDSLTPMTAVIGKNGVGKSTLFDAFGFLADCLKYGVEEACDARGRGGFEKIRSQGQNGPIEFEVYYKEHGNARPITYELSIDTDESGRPYVQKERLRQRRSGQKHGWPFSFLILNDGKGIVWKGEVEGHQIDEEKINLDSKFFIEGLQRFKVDINKFKPIQTGNYKESGKTEIFKLEDKNKVNTLKLFASILSKGPEESRKTEIVELEDKRKLGIATLGSLKQHLRISAFRRFIESWYLSYFTPDAARSLPLAGPQKHLNIHGDNLGNVVQFMEREYPKNFQSILKRIAEKIPGINKINTEKTPDGRLLLRFNDQGFKDPFYAQQMSDGTLKVFAYLILLEDPTPPPFLCIEEPENGLYHKLLESLAQEFREHATGRKGGSQIFITTHQPYFVDALEPEEVWVLEKGEDGFSTIRRASEDPIVKNLVKEGLPLGGLWYSDYLDAR